jgi:23S rRNA (cytidine1920-2'-O)/16S rRNA (cytidine1409-2'-O)-methyltransferase
MFSQSPPNTSQFVGRAGDKLDFALRTFAIDVNGAICADFGSAVGGFVDCLLQHGAAKVYAVETGYGVLDWKLRNDPRVVVLERTNAIHVELPEKVDLITVDASWTKQHFVIPNALLNLKPSGQILTLIKPHYEADKKVLKKGRLDPEVAEEVAREVAQRLESLGLHLRHFALSPVLGGKAENQEYMAHLTSE